MRKKTPLQKQLAKLTPVRRRKLKEWLDAYVLADKVCDRISAMTVGTSHGERTWIENLGVDNDELEDALTLGFMVLALQRRKVSDKKHRGAS